MRLVELVEGAVVVRWPWLPYWIGTNIRACSELERELRDRFLLNAMTTRDDDLLAMDIAFGEMLIAQFPDRPELPTFLAALRTS